MNYPYSRPGLRELKGVTVLSSVDEDANALTRGLKIFTVAERVSHEPTQIRIARGDNRKFFETKVNSLVGETVDVVVYQSPWQISGLSGVINYLQSIEASD